MISNIRERYCVNGVLSLLWVLDVELELFGDNRLLFDVSSTWEVPLSTYSSYTCKQRGVFIHRALAYCPNYMTTYLSALAAYYFCVFLLDYIFRCLSLQSWFSMRMYAVSKPSLTQPCEDLAFKERLVIWAFSAGLKSIRLFGWVAFSSRVVVQVFVCQI